MSMLYILDSNRIFIPIGGPYPTEEEVLKWSEWHAANRANCIVAQTEVSPGVCVSTVFLAINHSFLPDTDPILFETMVFDDYEEGQIQIRYRTWAEAQAGHDETVAKLKTKLQDRKITCP